MWIRGRAVVLSCSKLILWALLVRCCTIIAPSQTNKAPPIPKAGPLAEPRSLQQVGVPLDQTRATIPNDNPQSPEKIALGEKLFFDGRLSADGTVACATCHDPRRAFSDGLPTSIGIGGLLGHRNAPTIMNALFETTQFW